MAQIENTTAYPTVTPAASDLLIGTDVNNDNQTVTFLISDIVGAGGVAQDLQSVLTTGGSSTLPITLTTATGVLTATKVVATELEVQGSIGTAGQYLTSTGSGLQWVTAPTVTIGTLQQTLTAGNVATVGLEVQSAPIIASGASGEVRVTTPAALNVTGVSNFSNTVNVAGSSLIFDATGTITDGSGSRGLLGQMLTSTVTGLQWSSTIPTAAIPTLQQVLNAGSTATSLGMTFSGTSTITFGANNDITSLGTNGWAGNNRFTATGNTSSTSAISLGTNATIYSGGSIGTVGQVLTATGTGQQWSTLSVAADTLQDVLTAGDTATGNINLTGTINPTTITDGSSSTGGVGQVLTSTGGALAWAAAGTGSVTSITKAAETASSGSSLTISPTTGTVVVTPHIFSGGANLGAVPSSSAVVQTTHFLRADGTWQVPAENQPHGVENFRFGDTGATVVASDYYTLAQSSSDLKFSNGLTNSPSALAGTMSSADHVAGIIFNNPGEGSCATGFSSLSICEGTIQFISNVTGDVTVDLWTTNYTPLGTYVRGASNTIAVTAGAFSTANISFISAATKTLNLGEAFFITVSPSFSSSAAWNYQMNMTLRW
tara:strand:+ start:321 stop:2129 length:1809 start_codon:yes stop_codon:yes gene_type:complete